MAVLIVSAGDLASEAAAPAMMDIACKIFYTGQTEQVRRPSGRRACCCEEAYA
ncbi:MAG: hypothetical protein ACI33N_04545 [Desulfovibrionaceae bacterium]